MNELNVNPLYALIEYEKVFGQCPIDVYDVGPDELTMLIDKAIKENKPIPDPFEKDIPEGAIIA